VNDWHDELRRRIAGVHLRPEREAEIIDELAQHLDDEVRALTSGGIAAEAARATALAELDAPGELSRRLSGIETRPPLVLPPPGTPARGRWLHAAVTDLRYSLRALRRSPTFSLVVIVTLALTIGPTTAILSVGNWLVWRPIPGVSNPDQLAEAQSGEWDDRGDVTVVSISDANLRDIRARAKTFTGLAGIQEGNAHLAGDSLPPVDVSASWVSADAFAVLGVRFMAGRSFLAEEDREPAGEPVIIVRESVARRAYGSAEASIGQRLTLNGQSMTIVGVVAPEFQGISPTSRVDVWYPGSAYGFVNHFSNNSRLVSRSGGLFNKFVIRIAPGSSAEAAQAELDVLVPGLADRYPTDNNKFKVVRAKLTPGLGTSVRLRYASVVSTLVTIGGVLLLLGCANVANMLMLRAVRTNRDRAIRLALGASRARLAALQLTESATLAVCGSIAGVLLAVWLNQLIVALLFPGLPDGLDFGPPLDTRVLFMMLTVSVACGLLAGFVPALVSRSASPSAVMSAGGARTTVAMRWLRGGLTGAQLALSLALVTGSLLLVTTLHHLHAVDLGFDPANTSWHVIDPSRQGYNRARAAVYFEDLYRRLQRRPSLDAVALAGQAPFSSSFRVRLQDSGGKDRRPLEVNANNITAEYFDVFRIPIVQGRAFTDAEARLPANADYPVVVDQRLAKRLFGDENPIGRTVVIPAAGDSPELRAPVIGVAGDVHWNNVTGEQPLLMYQPLPALRGASMVLVRSRLPMRDVANEVDRAARELDASLPVRFSQPITSLIDRRLAQQRVFSWMLSLLGWLAFALAAVGLYGLLAQSVTERTREFGVRMALGSGRGRIFGLVLRQAAWIAGIGGLAGLGLAAYGTRLIEAQLYGVTRLDPGVYAAAVGALVTVVFAAALWPARSATRIQPVDALRAD